MSKSLSETSLLISKICKAVLKTDDPTKPEAKPQIEIRTARMYEQFEIHNVSTELRDHIKNNILEL